MRIRTALALLCSVTVSAALPGSTLPFVPGPAQPTAVTDVERLLAGIDQKERDASKQLVEIKEEARVVHERSIVRGRSYVKLSRAGLFAGVGTFESAVDHASRLERLRRAVERDVELGRKLARRQKQLSDELTALAERKRPLLEQRRAMDQARTALLAAQDRALAFERAFTSSGPSAHTTIYGASAGPTDPAELGTGLAAMQGRLPFPLPGRAEIQVARRPGADGPGLEMRVPRGTAVRAVYPGRVSFADSYASYGKTVIVDHGDRYYTVSASLSEILVRVGDEVQSGSRLGSVGDCEGGSCLYFEVRQGTKALDAQQWFGI
jgi:septal ring factor EnvC (AmiA/AmiB activator)